MAVIVLMALCVVLGAAGTEVLCKKNPKLIEKIEDRAKHLVNSLCLAKPTDEDEKEDK